MMIKENELPDGWKIYKLKDIGTVVTGSTPPKKDPNNYGGVLPWIKPPDLDNGMKNSELQVPSNECIKAFINCFNEITQQ